MILDSQSRSRQVTAVLGPTNTGKTHLAIERLLGHASGVIGLPLRLLAREVYDKIVARAGVANVALVTGEEKIKPDNARYWVSTVEAMPREIDPEFLAIDEVQLAADPERGHVFTDRLLNARGRSETLLLGAATMRDAIADLVPGAHFISRPRLSKLSYAGDKKITRLPPRSAVVAFSAAEVYEIAELIRRQRGGAAVVLGALSPRTRNAQVAMFQAGEVDFIVATDAIGMGLNLDVNHVALAGTRKFDGQVFRELTPSELAQIAGRAGRHLNDGTFGVTNGIPPLEPMVIDQIENHNFEPVKTLQWRARDLDFSTLASLRESLRRPPREDRLQRARMSDDVAVLEVLSEEPDIKALIGNRGAVMQLWDVCQVPDYRKISTQNHAELVASIFKHLQSDDGRIPEDWFARQVAYAEVTEGDIDTLSNRLAHIRTWTFVSNRTEWLKNPLHWQERTREIEDQLSDALHERLTQRFVDRRVSALSRGMRDKAELAAEISDSGDIVIEGHTVGALKGFRFLPETTSEDLDGKTSRSAAFQVLGRELSMRARRVVSAKPDAFKLDRLGRILWRGEAIAELGASDDAMRPNVVLIADDQLQGADRERIYERLQSWLSGYVSDKLKPLVEIAKAEDVTGLAKGIAFRLVEALGVVRRDTIQQDMKSLDQAGRGQLRKYGVRFGALNIFFPALMKPASTELALVLWVLKHGASDGLALDTMKEPPRPGLTSVPVDPAMPDSYYRTLGFHVCGPRAVRIDMLERLADQIRPLLAWRAPEDNPSATAPRGSTGDGGFVITPEMMSILGCSSQELAAVLDALGFRSEQRTQPPPRPLVETLFAGDLSPPISDEPGPIELRLPEPAEAAAAPQIIEMWRPKRRFNETRQGQRRDGEQRRSGLPGQRGRRNGSPPRQQKAEGPAPGQPGRAPESAGNADQAAQTGDRNAHGRHRDRDRDISRDERRFDQKSGDRPVVHGPQLGKDRQGRDEKREGSRDDRQRSRDRDRRGERYERPPQQFRSGPAKSKGPDPDSPFAALSALKAQLEKGKTG